MRVDVIMPQMGESIAEGTISKWLKAVGDQVKRDEPLLEISTDKVDAEIPSPVSGRVAEIRFQSGDTVEINTVIGVIETDIEQRVVPPSDADKSTGTAPAKMPRVSPTGVAAASSTTMGRTPLPSSGSVSSVEEMRRLRSSPLVRRIAREHNLDLRLIPGSGISGRVTRRDIMNYLETRTAPEILVPPFEPPKLEAERHAPAYKPGEPVDVVPMTPMRKTIAKRMLLSRRTSAHVTTVFEMDLTRLVRLRASLKEEWRNRHGINLTYTAFIAQACISALKAYPIFNASISDDNIVYKKDINLGIAVALEWGLIVPVVKRADEKNLLGLARSIQSLAERARRKQLTPDDVQGGTFTITNPGVFGSLFGTPIIYQPQVAILGVGAITKRPVITEDDAIAIRSMAYFSLSFDHRLIDGALGDQFMSHLKKTLETVEKVD